MTSSDCPVLDDTKKPRRRNSDLTVHELKAATTEQLINQGLSGLSIKPILDKAGVSRGALFHHFPTKNHLIAAAFADLLQSFSEALHQSGSDLRSGRIDVSAFVEQVVETFVSDMFIGSMEIALGIRVEPDLSELVKEAVEEWRVSLAAFWNETFELKGMDTAAAAQHWAMASNLLRGHAFTSTYGVEPGARLAFCKSFEKLILNEAVIKKETA
ncbi:TetR/AcrR family transcriptional regulator [Labrenzia sp. OB1]|uniref:TetR/AcrR family transcriptional regulator n=1 Tax=Labrenzia sp. OB1 TaxID=1561204 RepID=UPI000839A0BA|nr:TetR/AcrR family transcriptional regulator [Labrenzia sp. OB1]